MIIIIIIIMIIIMIIPNIIYTDSLCIYIYDDNNDNSNDNNSNNIQYSGGRLCTLIGVPCRLSMLSTFSTFANVLFQYKSPRAEGANTDPPPGHTYEGTQTTA